ncbi:hypothetical protein B5F94_15755, partial [Flavonifractor sp. An4]
IDVSKGKSVVSVLRPFGEVVAKPFSVGHTGSELKELADYLVACIRHYFPRQGGNLNCAGAHHGTLTPPRISPSCVSRSIIIG